MMRFCAGLKVNLRQYIKSDFDLFWAPDVLILNNRSPFFIRLLLNNFSRLGLIRQWKLDLKIWKPIPDKEVCFGLAVQCVCVKGFMLQYNVCVIVEALLAFKCKKRYETPKSVFYKAFLLQMRLLFQAEFGISHFWSEPPLSSESLDFMLGTFAH